MKRSRTNSEGVRHLLPRSASPRVAGRRARRPPGILESRETLHVVSRWNERLDSTGGGGCWTGTGMVDLPNFGHGYLIRLLHDRGWFHRSGPSRKRPKEANKDSLRQEIVPWRALESAFSGNRA
jgi:hypothetical protein